ncbi:MAG: EF-hand domain-containing protein [Verrucomicrobiota bacterium]
MKTKLLLIVSVISLALSSLTQAETDKSGPPNRKKMMERLKQIDADGDKVITYEEATAANAEKLLKKFAEIDTNGDNAITKEEMHAHRKAKRGERSTSSEES